MKARSGGPPHELRNKILVIESLVMIYLLSLSALAREADGFNRRVFGYFSTARIIDVRTREQQLADEARKKAQAQTSPAPTAVPTKKP